MESSIVYINVNGTSFGFLERASIALAVIVSIYTLGDIMHLKQTSDSLPWPEIVETPRRSRTRADIDEGVHPTIQDDSIGGFGDCLVKPCHFTVFSDDGEKLEAEIS